jgi:NAD(P)-dependent dehydrogenase (short-subunit alcohol dehydrogenase family)
METVMQQDRIVVITGAAGGVSSVLIDRFLANGPTVIAADAVIEGLEKLSDQRDTGVILVTASADISGEAECAELTDLVRETAARSTSLSTAA